ncbi:MIP/aquaporin family protein [Flavihumibacter petaseus]|uniref:Aquaglyceroporin n=1 Tax=Flavihumibacter petaseus NBRC 106054 TaxID=1220578 RepID=A0A0E9MW28_9BACT|nr:MIP/aquaporin family protein [Flavihumibacter petaseus]GAO41708.1 aquaglyceroporin [Flavihumibacter petaseus NBRC 106054]
MMHPYLAEFIGTCFLICLGNGVVANVLLQHSKGKEGGWIVIAFGWAMAVFVGVYSVAASSGAHLNPAVSICLAITGKFSWTLVPGYIAAQVAGAYAGASLVWLIYNRHYAATENTGAKLATFCTGPAIRSPFFNLLTETLATMVFLLAVLFITAPKTGLGSLDALPVALLVLAIGLSLGGPTGYAINPARDLGPRMAHATLPIPGKGTSDWGYAWIPVAGPVIGAILAALIFLSLQ